MSPIFHTQTPFILITCVSCPNKLLFEYSIKHTDYTSHCYESVALMTITGIFNPNNVISCQIEGFLCVTSITFI